MGLGFQTLLKMCNTSFKNIYIDLYCNFMTIKNKGCT